MSTTTRLNLEAFLSLAETEPPSELICGEVVQKPMPSPHHAMLVAELSALLRNYLRTSREAVVLVEPRHVFWAEERSYLPDISVIRAEHFPTDPEALRRGPIDTGPDLAIEVLSPDDRPGRVAEKLAFYLRASTPLVWVIDPADQTIAVHRPGAASTLHHSGETIDASPVLSGFTLDVEALFAVLRGQ
jgi:Uma2 family endonuclease